MKNFDDQAYKDSKSTFLLGLKSKKEKELSTWEISRFIFDLNTYYYKFEVINSIAIALAQRISPEDIIIVDESFMLNRQYGKLDLLNIHGKDLSQIYFMGLPYSIFPNDNVFCMRIVLKYYRHVNEMLFALKKSRNKATDISYYYLIGIKSTISKAIQEINTDTLKCFKKQSDKELVKNELERLTNIISKEINKGQKEIELDRGILTKIEEGKRSRIKESRSLNAFYRLLGRLQRPVVVVYNRKAGTGRILCRSQLNKKKKDNRTFVLRKVNQNSPLDLLLQGGLSLAMAWSEERRKKELHDAEIELTKVQTKKAQTEAIAAKIDLLNKQILLLKSIADLQNNPEYNQISTIVNPYIKEQLTHVNDQIVGNYQGLTEKSGLAIDYSTTHIDIQV